MVIAIVLGADSLKKWENVALEHCQFVERGAVKDNVCILLEGENPTLLTAANRIPHRERLLNRCASCFVVAHRAAQQAQISACNAVMVIEIERQQRADVHFEHLACVQFLGEQNGIEGVESLYDNNRILAQAQAMPYPLPLALFEVEGRDLHLFARKKLAEVNGEELGINGVDVLEVNASVRLKRNLVAVEIVIVKAH